MKDIIAKAVAHTWLLVSVAGGVGALLAILNYLNLVEEAPQAAKEAAAAHAHPQP